MKVKGLLIAGLAITLMAIPVFQENKSAAKEGPKLVQEQHNQEISNEEILKMVQKWVEKRTYVQNGGAYGEGEYQSFLHNETPYRYLAKDIDTKKEMISFLTQSVTRSYAEKFLKDQGIIQHKKRLAQVEADGGSLLQWDQATAKFEKINGIDRVYHLTVPVGETEEAETYTVSIRQAAKKDWKINRFEIVQQPNS